MIGDLPPRSLTTREQQMVMPYVPKKTVDDKKSHQKRLNHLRSFLNGVPTLFSNLSIFF